MMFTSCANANMMNRQTSANCAEAGFSCAKTSSNSIITILDAITMASIIITLISLLVLVRVSILVVSILVLLVLAVLLILGKANMCKRRITA